MFTLNCKGRLLVLETPVVMGIINITPDSFFKGSRHQGVDAVLAAAEQMLKEGAVFLDIGGQSTRPGSIKLDAEQELQRVIEPLAAVHRNFPEAYISIDTYYSKVAAEAIAAGACLINDISAGSIDPYLVELATSLRVPYVLMHMQGNPQTMQSNPVYDDVTKEVLDFLVSKKAAFQQQGLTDIIVDPGFGFGKNSQQNFQLLRDLPAFHMLDSPLLLGISRKSTIYKTLGIEPGEALNGTTVLHTIGLMKGASILRVHDVKEARQAIDLYVAYRG